MLVARRAVFLLLAAFVASACADTEICTTDAAGFVYHKLGVDTYKLKLQLPYRQTNTSPLVYDLTEYNYPCNPRYTKPGSPVHEGTLLVGCDTPAYGSTRLKVVLSDLTHAHVYLPSYYRSEQLSVVATVYCKMNGSPVE